MAGKTRVVIGVVLVAALLAGGYAVVKSRRIGTSKDQASYATSLATGAIYRLR